MSKLRKQLQQARHQYQHQRYPGDLANDLLGRTDVLVQLKPAKKPSHWVRNLALAAGLAIMATAGIALFRQGSASEKDVAIVTTGGSTKVDPIPDTDSTPTTVPTGPTSTTDTVNQTPSDTETEERWSLVPSGIASAQETSFSLVPSLAYESGGVNEAEQTTQQ